MAAIREAESAPGLTPATASVARAGAVSTTTFRPARSNIDVESAVTSEPSPVSTCAVAGTESTMDRTPDSFCPPGKRVMEVSETVIRFAEYCATQPSTDSETLSFGLTGTSRCSALLR